MSSTPTLTSAPVVNEGLQEYVFYNGAIVEANQCKVSHLDRGLLYGFGLFETLRGTNGQVIRLERHLERLFLGADFLGITAEMDYGYWTEAIHGLLEQNGLAYTDSYVRITLTGGLAAMTLRNQPGNTLIVAKPLPENVNKRRRGMKAFTLSYDVRRTFPNLKTLNYLPSVWGQQEAERRGYDEALFIDYMGNIKEGATTNVFAIRNGKLLTPHIEMGILPGIAREAVIRLAGRLGYQVEYVVFNVDDLVANCEGAFLTNSLIDIGPITHLNGKPISASERATSMIQALRLSMASFA